MMRRSMMRGDLNPEHTKNFCEVVISKPGGYNPRTGDYEPPQEVVQWSGMGSIQPYVRASLNAVQEPVGGLALAIDAFKIYLPHEALDRDDKGYKIRSNGVYYEPKGAPQNVGGRRRHWLVMAGELDRIGPDSGGDGSLDP